MDSTAYGRCNPKRVIAVDLRAYTNSDGSALRFGPLRLRARHSRGNFKDHPRSSPEDYCASAYRQLRFPGTRVEGNLCVPSSAHGLPTRPCLREVLPPFNRPNLLLRGGRQGSLCLPPRSVRYFQSFAIVDSGFSGHRRLAVGRRYQRDSFLPNSQLPRFHFSGKIYDMQYSHHAH